MSIVTTALKKIYEEEGAEVYLDKYRYYSLAEDYISDRDNLFLEQLYYCADNDILRIIYELHQETSDQKRESLFQKGKLLFVQNKKYSEEEASAFFQNYCDTFGWKMAEPEPIESETSAPKPMSTSTAAPTPAATPTPAWEATRTTVQRPTRGRIQTTPVKRKKHRLRYFFILVIVVAAIVNRGIIDWYAIHLDDPASIIRAFKNLFSDSGDAEAVVLKEEPQFDTSVYQPVKVTGAYASSVNVQEGIDNSPMAMFDGLIKTGWQEGAPSMGLGETAEGYFDQFYKVKYISFNLGDWRNYDFFCLNGVPYALNLTLGDFSQDINFSTDRHDLENRQWIEFTEPVRADSLGLEILRVFPGTNYVDTCISEITIYGIKE